MANLLEFKHLKNANDRQKTIDDSLRDDKIKPIKTQIIKKEEVLAFCNEPGSNGLKIILPVPLPASSPAKKRIITLAAFQATVPLLENEFALTTELLLSAEWFGPGSNFIFMKVNICKNGNKIYLIVNPSDDGDGGDGLKVKVPAPEG